MSSYKRLLLEKKNWSRKNSLFYLIVYLSTFENRLRMLVLLFKYKKVTITQSAQIKSEVKLMRKLVIKKKQSVSFLISYFKELKFKFCNIFFSNQICELKSNRTSPWSFLRTELLVNSKEKFINTKKNQESFPSIMIDVCFCTFISIHLVILEQL